MEIGFCRIFNGLEGVICDILNKMYCEVKWLNLFVLIDWMKLICGYLVLKIR